MPSVLDSRIWNIPSLPDNPLVAVAPFLPEEADSALPCTGRVIAEVVTHTLWQIPSLNLYHHWLLARDAHHLRHHRPALGEYARQFLRRHEAEVLLTGTYRLQRRTLHVHLYALQEGSSGLELLCPVMKAKGSYENLLRWLPCHVLQLANTVLPGCAPSCSEALQLIDAPLGAVELVAAALDYASPDAVYDSAEQYWQKASQLAPDSAYVLFASTIVGSRLRDVETCRETLQRNPDFLPACFPDDSVRSDDSEELREAQELYLRGLSRAPLNMHGFFGLREICVRLGDAETLIPFAKLHTVRGTFSSRYSEFGDAFLTCMEEAKQHGQYEMARQLFEAGMEIIDDPNEQARLLEKRGWIEEWDGDDERALWFYEQSLQIKRDVRLILHAADMYLGLGRVAEAEALYQQALSLKGRLSRTRRLQAEFGVARCYEETGRLAQARAIYERLSREPASNGTLYPLIFYASDWLRRHGK
ncbi:MAG: hypothetical protein NZ520_03715 [bacterium]|nr:hypothetical protein [bacterium]